MAILLLDTKVQIESALGSDITITGISQATEAVITATNTLSAGDYVKIKNVVGMTEINDRIVRVKSPSGTAFTAEGLDSTNFSAYVSGGIANEITSFLSFDNSTSFNFPEPNPNRIDITTIDVNAKKEIFGLDDAASITMNVLADPLAAHMVEVRKAATDKTTRGFVVTLKNGNVLIFNAYVAGGRGLDGSAGDVATGSVQMTLAATEQYFAS